MLQTEETPDGRKKFSIQENSILIHIFTRIAIVVAVIPAASAGKPQDTSWTLRSSSCYIKPGCLSITREASMRPSPPSHATLRQTSRPANAAQLRGDSLFLDEAVGFDDPNPLAGLLLLFRAGHNAAEFRTASWEFAVNIVELEGNGLSHGQLRWLVHRGYAEHGCERTHVGDKKRTFDWPASFCFSPATCFVLTASGCSFVAGIVGERTQVRLLPPPTADGIQPVAMRPHWDLQRRELWLGDHLVKRFRVPANNQEALLAAFEEEDWPERVDDPLPQGSSRPAKVRLHDTIKALNRCQVNDLLRFYGDGTGQAVLWKVIMTPRIASD